MRLELSVDPWGHPLRAGDRRRPDVVEALEHGQHAVRLSASYPGDQVRDRAAEHVGAHIRALALLGELLGLARMALERAPWPGPREDEAVDEAVLCLPAMDDMPAAPAYGCDTRGQPGWGRGLIRRQQERRSPAASGSN